MVKWISHGSSKAIVQVRILVAAPTLLENVKCQPVNNVKISLSSGSNPPGCTNLASVVERYTQQT